MSIDLPAVQTALADLEKAAGPKAAASITIKPREVHCYFRPLGWGVDEPSVLGYGSTPDEALAEARKQWDEMQIRVHGQQIRKMALAIIRLTHDQGECTDAALRAEFSSGEIDQLGAEAVAMANKMASNGPFEIVELQGANAA